ncbi:carboxylating nicotinate-nucleotide diphosphorylase [Bartonella sp. DGB2]|uniref:carboxylating nicotinate-nucleotide diphosphorylase n=1 Tax=Bartonella sp. DGB2 TaxID=3388426 RepID=UPI00399036EB
MAIIPDFVIEPIVRNALAEDIGLAGDITSTAVIPSDHRSSVTAVARAGGVVAGLDVAALCFKLLDKETRVQYYKKDGDFIEKGEKIATITGMSTILLGGERTALNFLSHLSGIATITREHVEAIQDYRARVVCTRKTTPGLRLLEKYAVRMGGGDSHRYGLNDGILIKDNHIAMVGSVKDALKRAKSQAGHMVKISVEVDTLAQLEEALTIGADGFLLDNMPPTMLREAVDMVAGRGFTEASGKVNLENIVSIAASGVDYISVGGITHSACILDIGFDF